MLSYWMRAAHKSPTSTLLGAFWSSVCLRPILLLHRRERVEVGSWVYDDISTSACSAPTHYAKHMTCDILFPCIANCSLRCSGASCLWMRFGREPRAICASSLPLTMRQLAPNRDYWFPFQNCVQFSWFKWLDFPLWNDCGMWAQPVALWKA